MQLLRSNNWENYYTSFLVMHKQPHYEIYYFIISININTYNKNYYIRIVYITVSFSITRILHSHNVYKQCLFTEHIFLNAIN